MSRRLPEACQTLAPTLPLTEADDYEWKYNGHVNANLFQRKNAEVWTDGKWKVYDPPTEGQCGDHYSAFCAANAVDGWRSRCRWCGDWAEDESGDTEAHAVCDPDFMRDTERMEPPFRQNMSYDPDGGTAMSLRLEVARLYNLLERKTVACDEWMHIANERRLQIEALRKRLKA